MLVMFILVLLSFDTVDSTDLVSQFLFSWKWKDLLNYGIWRNCMRQQLLGVVVGFGLYEALGSYSRHGVNVMTVGVWTPIIDAVTSLGISFVGFLCIEQAARLDGITGIDVIEAETSYSLIYELFPAGMSKNRSNQITCTVFYMTAIATMVTSGAVTIEAITTPVMTSVLTRTPRWAIVGVASLAGFLCSFPFWFTSGEQLRLWSIEIVELYVLFSLAVQLALLGWMYGRDDQTRKIGTWSATVWAVAHWMSYVAMCALFMARFDNLPAGPVCVGASIGILLSGALIALSMAASDTWEGVPYIKCMNGDFRDSGILSNLQEAGWWLLIGDVEICRNDVNGVTAGDSTYRATIFWSVCIKYLAPSMILTLTIHEVDALMQRPTQIILPQFQIVVVVLITASFLMLPTSAFLPRIFHFTEPPSVDVTRIRRRPTPAVTGVHAIEFMFQEFARLPTMTGGAAPGEGQPENAAPKARR
eukprot:Polyplicarium_translucidae@DN1637_c0_g1_i1.p1